MLISTNRNKDSFISRKKIGRKVCSSPGRLPRYFAPLCSNVYSRHVSNINSGHVLEVTDKELPHGDQYISLHGQDDNTEEENIKIFKGLSTFEEITIWEHDATLDESTDGVIRTIEEWIGFANKVGSLIMLLVERDADTLSLRSMGSQWTTKQNRGINFLFDGNALMDDIF